MNICVLDATRLHRVRRTLDEIARWGRMSAGSNGR
jgi:hypothetical protein